MLTLPDENTGRDEKQIQIGRKNIRFALETQDNAGLVTLPVARVLRDGSGRFIFDPSFIPPCLQISASERLLVIARTLVDILDEKSASLSRARRATAQGRAGYSSEEIASFWFVHTVNESLSVLRHFSVSERGHPEQLYIEMSRLGGALCTFGLESHPESLPAYNHDDLEKCFGPLNQHIRAHLELVVPSNCVQIPLVLAGQKFPKWRCFGSALPGSRAMGACRPRGDWRSGDYRQDATPDKNLLERFVARACKNSAARPWACPFADSALSDRAKSRISVFRHQSHRQFLGTHRANTKSRRVCSR